MALVLKDRVKETSTTAGTGTLTLDGAASGFQSFAAVGNGNTTYYAIVDPITGDWEVGLGTYTSSGTTLSRTTVLSSSNSGSLVNFAANQKDVFVTYPSEKSVYEDASNVVNATSFGAITATSAALTTGTVSTTPTSNTDIANKQYVDTISASGIHYHEPVFVESPDTAGNLNATYNNGASGVGATLTNAGTQVALTIDGVLMTTGKRVLIYNQTNAAQNGIYTVTTVGSGSTNWVLTRATDADTYSPFSPNSLGQGDAFFVTNGLTGAGETYICNTVGTITFGTTAITFAQISDSTLYTAGTGLTLTGTEFSITPTGTAGTYGSASSVPVLTTNASGQVTGVTNTNIAISGSAVSGNITGSAGSVANALTLGSYLTGTSFNGSSAVTATVDATSANTASKVVARDASGNFSAGTITATLSGSATSATTATNIAGGAANRIPYNTASGTTAFIVAPTTGSTFLSWDGAAFTYSAISTPSSVTFNSSGSGDASGTSFNGSTARTISYNTVGASPLAGSTSLTTTGTVTTGTWSGLFGAVSGANLTSLTAANLNGTVAVANGGSGASTASGARTNFGATTLGSNLFTITNPSAVTFPRFNADNTVSSLDAATFRSAIGAGTSSTTGTVTSITAGSYLTGGTITTSGTIAVDATSANTASKVVARDASGNFSAGTITATLSGNASTATSATTAGTITSQANSATITATSSNTANQIVLRDASGNFSAGTITASLNGNASTSSSTSGNAATATALSSGQSNWSGTGVLGNVVGMMAWKNYSNGHVIFDASAGTSPSGGAVNNTNAQIAWSGTYPTLMGWNGSNTYGVRVDSARVADSATSATSATTATTATTATNTTGGNVQGSYLGVQNTSGSTGYGLSLYNGSVAGQPTYGVMFAQTASFGTYGNVSADWATYFTMDATANRGWIFRDVSNGNKASISNLGDMTLARSLGVGTTGSGTAGEIRATNNVTAYYSSDIKFKENVRDIPNAAATAKAIGGKLFDWKDSYIEEHGGEDGYFIVKSDFGVIAQDVLAKFPVAVRTRPDGSLAVDYEKLSALALAANAEHEDRIAKLEALVAKLIEG